MILVTVGTNGSAFDRLLRELDDVSPGEEVFVQRGPSQLAPSGATCVDYLPFSELAELMAGARLVVTHAGVGSTLAAFDHGHRPILVPRLRSFGEAVDDHQLAFAARLDRDGLAVCVTDPLLIRDLVSDPSAGARGERRGPPSSLVSELAAYLLDRCPRHDTARSGDVESQVTAW